MSFRRPAQREISLKLYLMSLDKTGRVLAVLSFDENVFSVFATFNLCLVLLI